MRFHKLCRGALFVVAMTLLSAVPVLAEDTPQTDGLIVTFDESVSDKKVEEVVEKADGECENIDQFSEDEKVAQVSADDETETMETLEQNSYVKDVQPNYVYQISDLSNDPLSNENDQYYEYYMDQLQVSDAWALMDANGGNKVRVGIIDTGVDVKHEDLQANLANTESYCSFTNGSEKNLTEDTGIHGTHVAGIIGATADNEKGGCGVASGHKNNYVEIVMAGASDNGQNLSSYSIAASLNYLIEQKVQVINMSFGQSNYDYYLDQQIHAAYDQGIILVGSAGNSGTSNYNYPAAFADVISVNASNEAKKASYYSNYGEYSDVTSPGTDVASTVPFDKYDILSGTSMASPVTVSVVAMMLYADSSLSYQQVYDILCETTDRDPGSFDDTYGYGLINAYECVRAAYSMKSTASAPTGIYTKKASLNLKMNVPKGVNILLSPYNSYGTVNYTIADPTIAEIRNEMIWGLKPGSTTLTISCGNVTKEIPVTVTGTSNDVLTSISIKQTSMVIGIGVEDQNEITVETVPATYSGPISFYSNDNSIAMVEDGELYGISKGTCTITARAGNGQEAYVEVTVKDAIGSVSFSKYKEWMKVGDSSSFSAAAYDSKGGTDVYNSGVAYKSSNTDVATVDAQGNVTAVGEGYCYIYAESKGIAGNGISDYCRDSVRLQVAAKDYSGTDYNFAYKDGTLSWKKIPGISWYLIEASEDGKTYTSYKMLTCTSLSVSKAKKCYYRMKAGYKADGVLSYFNYSNTVTVNADYKNYNLRILKTTSGKAGYRLAWNQCSYAKGYYIFRKTGNGSFAKIATVGTVGTYQDNSVAAGTKYSYQVKAYASNDSYSTSNSVSAVTTFSASNYQLKIKNHKLTWKKAPAATGYEIQRKVKGGKFRTIAKVKAVASYVDKKASKKVTYQYRIRGIYDKSYMGWSVTK